MQVHVIPVMSAVTGMEAQVLRELPTRWVSISQAICNLYLQLHYG